MDRGPVGLLKYDADVASVCCQAAIIATNNTKLGRFAVTGERPLLRRDN